MSPLPLRAYVIASPFACSRLRRSLDVVCCVKHALCACFTQHTTSFGRGETARTPGERGRRLWESDTLSEIVYSLFRKVGYEQACFQTHYKICAGEDHPAMRYAGIF